MNDEYKRSAALEELKIISSIIGRIENAIYQKQGWLFTLITGLTLALFNKNDPYICKQQFLIISLLITAVFLIADVIQRTPVKRAILRSKKVETSLRDNTNFDSPLISKSLSDGKNFKDFLETVIRPRVFAPYLGIVFVILIIWSIAS
jgi:hypothetical protein